MTQLSSISGSMNLRQRLEAMPTLQDVAHLQSQRSFDQALGRAQGRAPSRDKQDEARAAAEELVSRALVQPILAKLRESRDAAEPFGPSEVERAFGSISDAQFADRLTKSGNWPLVDSVARHIINAGKPTADITPANTNQSTSTPPNAALAPLSVAAWAGMRKVNQ